MDHWRTYLNEIADYIMKGLGIGWKVFDAKTPTSSLYGMIHMISHGAPEAPKGLMLTVALHMKGNEIEVFIGDEKGRGWKRWDAHPNDSADHIGAAVAKGILGELKFLYPPTYEAQPGL